MVVFGGSNSVFLARHVAGMIKQSFSVLDVKKFPDGELYIRFLSDVKKKDAIIVNSMHPNPNDSLVELYFSISAAKELGAKRVTVVVPYMGYLRQDKRFRPGEVVSNRLMASLLDCADKIITVDPHIHRIKSLADIFDAKTIKVSANRVLAKYIDVHYPGAVIVGPDFESAQWAVDIAKSIKHHAILLKKKRYGARTVRIKVVSDISLKGKTVVIVDDIISSGHTMMEPIKQLKKLGVRKIVCVCIHGLFAEGSLAKLRSLGAEVISTNTIDNPVAKIDVSGIIADSLT